MARYSDELQWLVALIFSILYLLIMKKNFMLAGLILCSHHLSVAAHAADQNSPAFEAGITVLLKQELAKQADCANNEPSVCDDSEVVAFLKILGLYQPIEQPTPVYPINARYRGVNGVVISELSIAVNGEVENVSTVECRSGDGDSVFHQCLIHVVSLSKCLICRVLTLNSLV